MENYAKALYAIVFVALPFVHLLVGLTAMGGSLRPAENPDYRQPRRGFERFERIVGLIGSLIAMSGVLTLVVGWDTMLLDGHQLTLLVLPAGVFILAYSMLLVRMVTRDLSDRDRQARRLKAYRLGQGIGGAILLALLIVDFDGIWQRFQMALQSL